MTDLIARLQTAKGPSRELDGEIWKAVSANNRVLKNLFVEIDGVWHLPDPDDKVVFEPPPHFTASLDAALTLVPEEWVWAAGTEYGNHSKVRHKCGEPHYHGDGASVAICICIAALCARGVA